MADQQNGSLTPTSSYLQAAALADNYRPRNTYPERFANAAVTLPAPPPSTNSWGMFGKRLFEEFGLRDIWDEFARFDDEGMSISHWLSIATGAASQITNMPFQAMVAGAREANQLGGAINLTLQRGAGTGLYEGRKDTGWTTKAFSNYLTGGMTWEEQEQAYSTSAPGVHYNALTWGDTLVVRYDQMLKAGTPNWLATARSLGLAHRGADDAGPLTNGTYIPRNWDMMSPDAGAQLDRAGIYESQRAVSNTAGELILDPLNFLAAPIGGMVAARKGFTLVGDGLEAGMLGHLIGTGADLTGSIEISKVTRARMNRPAGMGLWNQARMLDALQQPDNPLVRYLLTEKDPDKMARQLRKWGMITDLDAGFRFAKVARIARDERDVIHLSNAASFRDVNSVRVIDDLATSGSQTIRDDFMTALGLQDDMFTQAALDFSEGGQIVPKGHVLADNAKQFVDEVLDDNPAAKAAWDALGDPQKQNLLGRIDDQQEAMHSVNRLFGDQHAIDPVTGERLVPEGVERTVEFIPRDRFVNRDVTPGWLRQHVRTIVPENVKRLSRSAGAVILMDKPGLAFSLHGPDATAKFNEIIEWTDRRIHGPVAGRRAARAGTARFRVGDDEELTVIHDRWMKSAVNSKEPPEIRAALVNDLQSLVLRRMAEANGIDADFAKVIADYGMDRGRKMVQALTDAERGYTAAVVEDGRTHILHAQPMVERQAANFVPLMDWDAAFKAMSAIGRREHAFTSPGNVISKATATSYLPAEGKLPLKYVGRERTIIGKGAHLILDVADAVNHIFKTSVLLRLGYPFRNIAEGTASSIAAGTSMLELLKFVDLGGLIAQRAHNFATIPTRLIDRVFIGTGQRMSDDAALIMGLAHGEVDNLIQDRLHSLWAIIGDDNTSVELGRIINDVNTTPEMRQQAQEALRWLNEQRMNLAVGITEDNRMGQRIAGGWARPISSQDAAQHLYHADTVGDMSAGQVWDSEGVLGMTQPLDRPIRLTDNPVIAHGQVNLQWNQLPTSGPKSADRADALRRNASAAGGGSLFRYTNKRTGKVSQTGNADTVLKQADLSQPVTVHRAQWVNKRATRIGPGKQVTIPPDSITAATKGKKSTHHLQMRDNPNALWRPFDSRQLTPTTEVRELDKATHPNGFPKAVSVDTWGREIDLRSTAVRNQLVNDLGYQVDQPLLDAAIKGDHAAQDKVMEALANPNNPSSPKIVRAVFPDSRKNGWGRYQIIVHPDGVGQRGFRAAVQANMDEAIEAAARARKSETEMGVARSLGGKHVRRIAGRNRREMRRLNRTAVSDIPAEERQAWLHGLVGQPLVPNSPLDTVQVLQNGGFQGMVDQLTDIAVASRRNRYTMNAIYQERKATMARMAKQRGIRSTANTFRFSSIYGDDRVHPSLLGGDNGAMYGMLASGDATHAMGYTQMGYYTDWMRDAEKAFLEPTTLTPDDPRYWDGLANLFNRQYRDAAGFNALRAVDENADWFDNLDPVVRRLLEPGDRTRVVEETIDWALHTEQGRQWMRTIGLEPVPPRGLAAEAAATERAQRGRRARDLTPPATTRAQRRVPVEGSFRVGVTDANVGDVIGTMANFLYNHVMHDARAVDALVSGRDLTGASLKAIWDSNPWELKPISGLLSPTTAEARALLKRQRENMGRMEAFNHQIVSGMGRALRAIGSGPETRLLRHPVFEAIGQADLRQRMAFAEQQVGRSLSLEEINQLRGKSQQFALKKMEQTLYTLSGRSRADDWLRFISPFLPAHRNAITRWGRIALTEPGRVGRMASHIQTVMEPMHIVTQDGEEVDFAGAPLADSYVVMPGIGGIAEKVLGVPGAADAMRNTYIPVRSLDLLFQGDISSPGFGPWVTAPLQWFMSGHPEWVKGTIGKWIDDKIFPVGPVDTGNQTWDAISAFLPTGVRRFLDTMLKGESWAGEYDRNLRLLMVKQASGETDPMSPTELFDKAKSLTNLKMSIKVASAFASPVAAQQRGRVEEMAQVWRSLRDAYGNTEKADQMFSELFPDDYLLTLSSSRNLTGSASTASAVDASKRLSKLQQYAAQMDSQDLLGFFENYDDEAFLQNRESEGYSTEDYSPWARLYQRHHAPEGSSDPYREKRTPEESLRNAKVKDGWLLFDQTKAKIQMELAQRGLAAGTYEYQKELDGRMAISSDLIGRQNPEWADEYGKRDENRLMRNEMFFKAAISDPSLGFITEDRKQHALIQSMQLYFQMRDAIRSEILRRWVQDDVRVSTTASVDHSDLAMALAMYREKLANSSPAFRQWVDRYFRNDAVGINDADLVGATRRVA